jgi:nucleoside-diphosphate-sugar epimerase
MNTGSGGGLGRSLVTGAGGFIGSHLARELVRSGKEVTALDLNLDRLRDLEGPAYVGIEADLVDPDVQDRALQGVDTVYHLAAAHLGVASGEEHFRKVNVEALETFTRSAARAGVRRFVHCSSVGVYGRIEAPPADEDTACRPRLVYEKTKLEGEQVILDAVAETGFPAVVLRPAWVYGPGCPRTERLFRTIGSGRFFVAGSGKRLRHCIYIGDMLEAFVRAAEADDVVGRVIVVGDARAVTVRELVDEIARLTGAKRPRSLPYPLIHAAAVLAETAFRPLGAEPPLSRRTLEFFRSNTAFRIERARRYLGFEPRHDLASGLAQTHRILSRETGSAGDANLADALPSIATRHGP